MKTLDEVKAEWAKDAKIDASQIEAEALKVSELHSKYYNAYLWWMQMRRKRTLAYKKILADRTKWYMGQLSQEEMESYGWYPNPLAIKNNKSALDPLLSKDKELNDFYASVEAIGDVTDFIKSILDNIAKRNFQIKNVLDFRKFGQGA